MAQERFHPAPAQRDTSSESTNPANDTIGSLSNIFRRFSCTYGGSCPAFPGTGNGFLYSYTPMITITPSAIGGLTYGNAAPNLSGYAYNTITSGQYLSAGDFAADSVTGSLTGDGLLCRAALSALTTSITVVALLPRRWVMGFPTPITTPRLQ